MDKRKITVKDLVDSSNCIFACIDGDGDDEYHCVIGGGLDAKSFACHTARLIHVASISNDIDVNTIMGLIFFALGSEHMSSPNEEQGGTR